MLDDPGVYIVPDFCWRSQRSECSQPGQLPRRGRKLTHPTLLSPKERQNTSNSKMQQIEQRKQSPDMDIPLKYLLFIVLFFKGILFVMAS